MTRFRRWARNALERHLRRYYEGPEPPQRLLDMVFLFANENPEATRRDWIAFAAHHAEQAYRSGYVRGYELSERVDEENPAKRYPSPEDIADAMDPGWRHSPNVLAWDADEVVGRGAASSEAMADARMDQERDTGE